MSQGGERFPKRARLTQRPQFLTLSQGAKRIHTPHFVILSKTNDVGESRLGVTVSAKVGKSVIRNRIKRRLREFFRRNRRRLPACRDYVIVARRGAGEITLEQAARELAAIFHDRRA